MYKNIQFHVLAVYIWNVSLKMWTTWISPVFLTFPIILPLSVTNQNDKEIPICGQKMITFGVHSIVRSLPRIWRIVSPHMSSPKIDDLHERPFFLPHNFLPSCLVRTQEWVLSALKRAFLKAIEFPFKIDSCVPILGKYIFIETGCWLIDEKALLMVVCYTYSLLCFKNGVWMMLIQFFL